MFSVANTNTKVAILLTDRADWANWHRDFEATMRGYELFDYFEGQTELLSKPPHYDVFKIMTRLRKTRENAAKLGISPKDVSSAEFTDNRPGASTAASTLHTSEDDEVNGPVGYSPAARIKKAEKEVDEYFKAYGPIIMLEIRRQFEGPQKAWEEQKSHLANARAYMKTTVSATLQNGHYDRHGNLRAWYTSLKSIAPTSDEIRDAIRTRLEQHLAALKATEKKTLTRRDFDRWLTTWRNLMDEENLHRAPNASPDTLWFYYFTKALGGPLFDVACMLQSEKVRQGAEPDFRQAERFVRLAARSFLKADSPTITTTTAHNKKPRTMAGSNM